MKKLVLIFLFVCFVLSGCASIITQTTQKITLQAEPKDSKILINGIVSESPASAQLERGIKAGKKNIIKVEKDEYVPCEFKTRNRFNAWFIGNILLGGLIGMAIDLGTGAVVWIQEENSFVILNKDKPCDIYFKTTESQKDWYKYSLEKSSGTVDDDMYYRDTDGTWKIKVEKTETK